MIFLTTMTQANGKKEDSSDHEADDFFGPTIFKYTSDQATEDGFLLDLRKVPAFANGKAGMISHVTTNLLSRGYWEKGCELGVSSEHAMQSEVCRLTCKKWREGERVCDFKKERQLRIVNVIDLVNQANSIIRRKRVLDTFYSGYIETPEGKRVKIFIEQNEFGCFTAMLPEDH